MLVYSSASRAGRMGRLSSTAAVLAFSCLCLFSVNGYEVVYPFKADSTGNKRELSTNVNGEHQDVVAYVLERDFGDMVLELKRDVGFHANKVLMRTFDDDGSLRSEMHAPESCHYSGKIADKEDSYVLLDTCDGLRGSIEDGEKRYNLEPMVENQGNGAHKLYEVENVDEDLSKRTVGVNPFSEDYIEIPEEEHDAEFAETKVDDEYESSQANPLPSVDPVYAKYPITKTTRYCEVFLIVDNAIYVKYNRSKNLVLSNMLKMIHAVDRTYAGVNIRVVLVAIEIWTDKNKIKYDYDGLKQLGELDSYRNKNLPKIIRHDVAHYISAEGWRGRVLGKAYLNGICRSERAVAMDKWSFSSLTGASDVFAHELGHGFGFTHDADSCKCLSKRGCVMGKLGSRRPGFTDCNMRVLSDPKKTFSCLYNYPRGSLGNICGNGIIEGSEECDCGTPEACKKIDSCCQPHNCKLKRSAQCSDFNSPDCCRNCLFKRQGTLCRKPKNNCDIAEYCTGESATCPADAHQKDGETCSYQTSVITGNLGRGESLIVFNPPIKARYFRFNPVYRHRTWACMRMELLTCSADEDVIHVPQPISTRKLTYTSSLCFVPDSVSCADSKARDAPLVFKREKFGDCNKANYLFTLENDGTLRHNCSGKVVCPGSGNYLSLKNQCPDDKGKYKRLANFGLKNIKTGGCVEATGGWPSNNKRIQLRWTEDCDGRDYRTKLYFLESDCLLPAGMENGKLPDSAFTASSYDDDNPPKEARLNVGDSWCPPEFLGENEYLQIDIGKIKTMSSMRLEGTRWNWVTGFKLSYSDLGKDWQGYSSNEDFDKVITGNLNESETSIAFNPHIKARHLRFNPVYWPNSWACMRMELLTCGAEKGVTPVPQPISTRKLTYTSSLCFVPDSVSCADSKARDAPLVFKREKFGDCNKANYLFTLENDGTLRHSCSGKVVCPGSGNYLSLKNQCPDDKGKYKRLANFGLKNIKTGSCVEAKDGWPSDKKQVQLRSTKDCDGRSDRTKLHFLESDCLMPAGMENGKLPDSAFTASSYDGDNPPAEARFNVGDSWCPPKYPEKNEYLQIDLGMKKSVSSMKLDGTDWNWVSGFKLFYSDDAKIWKEYSSHNDLEKSSTSYCYSGSCSKSLSNQCMDLWNPGTRPAGRSCWTKLNTEANGFGTCDPAKNQPCALKDVFCGQLQCNSGKTIPHKKYGTVYKELFINGTRCSAASITIPGSSNDQTGTGLGMVADGTKCGDGKMCFGYSCKSISELKIKKCPEVNGKECAGQGICDNKGKCHCSRGLDPKTNCTSGLNAINGNWGQWISWSTCTSPCNGGTRQRSRFCDAPFPAHGGKDCAGDGYQEEQCHTDACPKAKSCKLLMKKLQDSSRPMIDGVYNITMPDGSVMPMYCDMTRDGGGWTLVVTARTNTWTTSDMVRERNKDKPSLLADYSILKYIDPIKENYDIDDDTFEYRLEAHTRGRWGGIWIAPIAYKFDKSSSSQTNLKLIKKFDKWTLGSDAIANRMPHIVGNRLTTQTGETKWGSITGSKSGYFTAPWISGDLKEPNPEYIWYWMREGTYKKPFSCTEIRLRALMRGHKPKTGLYQIQTSKRQIVSTFCDMDSFGGGWTMVLNKVSNAGWTKATTLSRNADKASKFGDYSILSYSKGIASLKKQEESTFQYMIEADGHQRWGGIFEARMEDAVAVCNIDTKKPKLLKKFDNWNESKSNLAQRVPFLLDNPSSYLTTEKTASSGEDGVLVSSNPSVYIKGSKEKPKFIRMWVREISSKRSCNQIKVSGQRKGVVYKNGYYVAKKSEFETRTLYCDMTSDSGGWTLLLTSARGGWTKDQVLSRNEDLPSITDDYSILHIADSIKSMSNNATFRYKLDAHKFNHWGGIWEAPMKYTFLSKSWRQMDVKLIQKFDKWDYDSWGAVNKRMPWLGERKGILTTSQSATSSWWGSIISENSDYNPAPYIHGKMGYPGIIWYWINEDDCSPNRAPVDGALTPWSLWTQCSVNCGKGISTRIRTTIEPKKRCGGIAKGPMKESRECSGKCLVSPMRGYSSNYCVLPKSGKCNVSDETVLQWKSGIDKCDLPEAQFIVDYDRGSITHKCSGKPVCPSGGKASNGKEVVISSKCPPMQLTKRFTRTMFDTLHFDDSCVYPKGGSPGNNIDLVTWTSCISKELKILFYKTEKGPVHAKFWQNVDLVTNSIDDILKDTRFPNSPTTAGFLDNFDSPYDIGYKYGLQMWSYFVAPESGLYTFYSACDDTCQVFLSSTDREADKKMIIFQKGWSRQYKYDQRSDQKSKKISLTKGNLYYLESIFVEIRGGDHLSVAVDLPSGTTLKPIPGYYLRAKG